MICGCLQSKLDGTEKEVNLNLEVPKTFNIGMPPVLDQGNTYKCVAYSIHNLINYLINIKKAKDSISIDEVYNSREKKIDGMSIKEALKYVYKKQNKDYSRIASIDQLKKAIIAFGPCLCALPVYSSDMQFWNGSDYQGGHCVLITGYDEYGFTIMNSWGRSWGDGGYTYLPYNDIDKVLELWAVL